MKMKLSFVLNYPKKMEKREFFFIVLYFFYFYKKKLLSFLRKTKKNRIVLYCLNSIQSKRICCFFN